MRVHEHGILVHPAGPPHDTRYIHMSTRSSRAHWRARPGGDALARQAARRGLGSRAWFKLEALDTRFRLIRPGMKVLELGAAPGGWTRYLVSRGARAFACDQRAMPVPGGVDFLCAQVPSELFRDWCTSHIPYNLLVSDLAPNMSGVRTRDMAQAQSLVAFACELAEQVLSSGGGLVVKLFQGEPLEYFEGRAGSLFHKVRLAKPRASRAESSEIYGVAQGFSR